MVTLFLIQGFEAALILELQEKGADYSDQSYFSIIYYPFLFKLLFAPFIDTYFLKELGKCRTYLIACNLLIGILLFIASPRIDSLLDPSNMGPLVSILFAVNFVSAIALISGEVLILKAFGEEEKGKGSMVFDLGMSTGVFVAYNIFVPLSNKEWVQKNIWGMSESESGLINNQGMLIIIASLSILLAVFMLFFVQEKEISDSNKERDQNLAINPRREEASTSSKPTICSLLKIFPQFLLNPFTRNFLIMVGLNKVFKFLYLEVLMLKMIDHGIKKTTIVNMTTVTLPLYYICSIYAMRFMKKGRLMKIYFYMSIGGIVFFVARFLVIVYLASGAGPEDTKETKETTQHRTVVMLYVMNVLDNVVMPSVFINGFINIITPAEIGSTYLTFIYCWNNITGTIPNTVGLRIVGKDFIDWRAFVSLGILGQILTLAGYTKYLLGLDKAPVKDFDIRQKKYTLKDCCKKPDRGDVYDQEALREFDQIGQDEAEIHMSDSSSDSSGRKNSEETEQISPRIK